MNSQEVWEVLGKIPIGTIIAWGVVIIAILGAINIGMTKLFGFFGFLQKRKEREENTKKRLQRHDEMLANIDTTLQSINEAMRKSMRYDIVRECEAAIANNKIQQGQLRALEELYEAYTGVGGNQYATTLMKKVRQLPVENTLEQH